MTHTPDRLTYITGLRDLADFLDTNPDMPTPEGTVTAYHFADGTDEEIRGHIDHIARLLSAEISPDSLNYCTGIRFGLVEYKAVGVLAAERAKYAAEASYWDCVAPDTDPTDHAADAA